MTKHIQHEIKDKIWEMASKKFKMNLSASELASTFNLSLSYVYDLIRINKLKANNERNRKVYELKAFMELFNFEDDIQIYESYSSVEEALNFSINFEAKNPLEKFYVDLMIDELGEFTSAKKIAELFQTSETLIYEEIERGYIISIVIGNRKILLTRSLLYYFRKIFI